MMADIYSTRILKSLSECGSYLSKRQVNLVKFHSLNDDVTTDIASFKTVVTQQYISSNNILLEKGVIANRAKIKEAQCKTDGDICPKHRYNLGKYHRFHFHEKMELVWQKRHLWPCSQFHHEK